MSDELEFIFPDWPAPARVRAVFTTRVGGSSSGAYAGFNLGRACGDDPASVSANRALLQSALQLPGEPRWLRQVHGTRVVAAHDGPAEPEADASYTAQPGVVCAVQAADCLPVLFCDRAGSVVAAAHAGWRGLAAGVLEATIAALPVEPAGLLAWLGPVIGPEAFEVGAEVREAFVARAAVDDAAFRSGAGDRYFADLHALARSRLSRAGVRQLYGEPLSTHADSRRFFSFRRDRVTGRMAALIWLQP